MRKTWIKIEIEIKNTNFIALFGGWLFDYKVNLLGLNLLGLKEIKGIMVYIMAFSTSNVRGRFLKWIKRNWTTVKRDWTTVKKFTNWTTVDNMWNELWIEKCQIWVRCMNYKDKLGQRHIKLVKIIKSMQFLSL